MCRDDDDNDGDGDDPEAAFDEMDAILGIAFGGKTSRSPQIEKAMEDRQMLFYTHEKCHKFIRRMWRPIDLVPTDQQLLGTDSRSHFGQCLQWLKTGLMPVLILLLSPILFFYQDPLEVTEMKEERKNQILELRRKRRMRRQNGGTSNQQGQNGYSFNMEGRNTQSIVQIKWNHFEKWMSTVATPRNRDVNFYEERGENLIHMISACDYSASIKTFL